MKALNDAILAQRATFAPAGGYRFTPSAREPGSPINPRDPFHDGVREALWVGDQVVAKAAADGVTYCCGITLEVWWRAFVATAGRVPVADPEDAAELVATWFCPTMGHPGVVPALVDRGLGVQVPVEHAQPGDLCQFWRRTDLQRPSGHSVVFLADEDRGERWMRYWSSQPATQGIGEHAERWEPGWQVHVVRAVLPPSP